MYWELVCHTMSYDVPADTNPLTTRCVCLLQWLSIREKNGANDDQKGKEMLYLTTHSTHFIYGVGHMVKDHSDSERENPLPPHRLLFPISSKVFCLYAPSHRQDCTYQGLCYTSRGLLAGTRNSSMGPHHEGSIREDQKDTYRIDG